MGEYDESQCGIQNPRPSNTGEFEPYPGQYPWVAQIRSITKSDTINRHCLGTLISDQWVLLNAGCVLQNDGHVVPEIVIQLGRYNLSQQVSASEEHLVLFTQQIFIHPLFNGELTQWNFDFALAKLGFRLAPNLTRIRPICLPDNCDEYLDPQSQIIDQCDWTEFTDWQNNNLDHLPSTNSSLLPHEVCNRYYNRRLSYVQICTNGSMSICNGYSGAFPLMCRNNSNSKIFLLGNNAWTKRGDECGQGYPVYSRVCAAMPWIKRTMLGVDEIEDFPPLPEPIDLDTSTILNKNKGDNLQWKAVCTLFSFLFSSVLF